MPDQIITEEADFNQVDYANSRLAIGVDAGNPNAPYLQLDLEDVQLLKHLLTKVKVGEGTSAFDVSSSLNVLALWCAGAERWLQSNSR